MNPYRVRWSKEEMLEIVNAIPISVLKDRQRTAKWVMEKGYSRDELSAILTLVGRLVPDFGRITVRTYTNQTFGEFRDYYELAQINFVVIHRLNYLLHYLMLDVYDLLEKENRLRLMAKKNSKKAEEIWGSYEKTRFGGVSTEARSTFDDQMRISMDVLQPRLDKVYETIRDYMIRLGWRDVELKAKIEVVFRVGKVARHSFHDYFCKFEELSGADFSRCFEDSVLQPMVKCFAMMSESLGIKTDTDRYGLPCINGFDFDASVRMKSAWKSFIKDLRDTDLMDKCALRAIKQNPKAKEDYERQLAEDAQKQLEEGIEKLSEKFKVRKDK